MIKKIDIYNNVFKREINYVLIIRENLFVLYTAATLDT